MPTFRLQPQATSAVNPEVTQQLGFLSEASYWVGQASNFGCSCSCVDVKKVMPRFTAGPDYATLSGARRRSRPRALDSRSSVQLGKTREHCGFAQPFGFSDHLFANLHPKVSLRSDGKHDGWYG